MRSLGTFLQIPKHTEFLCRRHRGLNEVFGKLDWPTGIGPKLLRCNARVYGYDLHLTAHRIRLHDAQIRDQLSGSLSIDAEPAPVIAALAMAQGGDEV
jgi:hypothetical protein